LLRHFKSTHLDKISASEVEQYETARLGQFKTARGKDGRKDTKKKIQPSDPRVSMPERFMLTLQPGGLRPWKLAYHKTAFEDV
jgi:hypothetical protein